MIQEIELPIITPQNTVKTIKTKKSLRQRYLFFRLFRKDCIKYLMKVLTIKFSTRNKLSEKEIITLSVIRKLCNNSNTVIIPSSYGYFISNTPLHVECLITTKVVVITNSSITTEKSYDNYLIYKLNTICRNRLNFKCDKIVESMLNRENIMLNNIKNQL